MSNIPLARSKLQAIVDDPYDVNKDDLKEVIALLNRRAPRHRAPTQHLTVTQEQIRTIRALRAVHPEMHVSEIATRVGTNPGRVSEVLHP